MSGAMDVLVVGGGMYVCGRGDQGYGTIGPALLEARRQSLVNRVVVATTSAGTATNAVERLNAAATAMGVAADIQGFPAQGRDPQAYLEAARQLRPALAIVSVPDDLHAEVTVQLCKLGIHCLVVKPLAPDVQSGRLMVQAAAEAGVYGMVEFHKRHDEANLMLRDAVVSGSMGLPLYAVIEYSQPKRIPRDVFREWAHRTSIFQYLGVHYVDLLQFITGFTPIKVTAWGQKDYLAGLGIDTWDAMQVVVQWRRPDGGSFVSTHMTNWIDPDNGSSVSDQAISLVGSKGRFDSDQKRRGVRIVSDDKGQSEPNPYFCASWTDPATNALTYSGYGIRSILGFVTDVRDLHAGNVSLKTLTAIRPSFAACLQSTAVIEAAHKSLAGGSQEVEISL